MSTVEGKAAVANAATVFMFDDSETFDLVKDVVDDDCDDGDAVDCCLQREQQTPLFRVIALVNVSFEVLFRAFAAMERYCFLMWICLLINPLPAPVAINRNLLFQNPKKWQ